jgi:hypothetical protein
MPERGGSGAPLALIPLLELPPDLQRHILGWVPLRGLAQLACLNKELRSMYLDRVMQRDAVIASLLESHFTPDFLQGLSCRQMACAQMALPRDLMFDPPVRHCSLRTCMAGHLLHTAQYWVPGIQASTLEPCQVGHPCRLYHCDQERGVLLCRSAPCIKV